MASAVVKKTGSGVLISGSSLLLGATGLVVTILVLGIGSYFGATNLSLSQMLIQATGVGLILPAAYALVSSLSPTNEAAKIDNEAAAQLIDPLTRVHNSRGITINLIELIALAERYRRKFSVAITRVDHMDQIVGDFGESARDQSLCSVAEAISDVLRMPDRVGRYSDEVFLLILPETELEDAKQIAERVRSAVAESEVPVSSRKTIHPTVSVGLTEYRAGEDMEQLLSRAQAAVEDAETEGRNRVVTAAVSEDH